MNNLKTIVPICALLFLSSCSQKPHDYDICVYGGNAAGVMAAVAAKRMGKSVLLIEPGQRLGGLTSGGLGQTDIGNKYAVVGLSRDFYRRLGKHYGNFENWVFEPSVAEETFRDYIREEGIDVWYGKQVTGASVSDGIIQSIQVESSPEVAGENAGEAAGENANAGKTAGAGEAAATVSAKMFLDCSYEGDLMALAGVSYTVGREANSQYNETINGVQLMKGHQFPDGVDPYVVPGDPQSGLLWGISEAELAPNGSGDKKVQAYNFRICLTDSAENRIPVSRPENYDSTRYELLLRLIAAQPEKRTLNDYFIWSLMPNRKTDINNRGGFSTDMIGMNYGWAEGSPDERRKIFKAHLDYTKGLLYFLGNDPRVPDTLRRQIKEWGYPKDEYPETGHFTPQLYVREARRMIGEYVMTEANCRGDVVVEDGIGLAAYTMDSHNCQRLVVNGMVKNEGNVEVGGFPPYPISYRSLTPRKEECRNLLVPVCLSATHIAYGSIRMEPVFMVMGQVAAVAASMAIDEGSAVQDVDAGAINRKMETDPLLDGTLPDVTVDNEDTSRVELKGSWEPRTSWMRTYKADYLYHSGAENASLRFKPLLKKKGSYNVYFYCPGIAKENISEFPVVIRHASGSDTVSMDIGRHYNSWGLLGTYDFDPDGESYVEVPGAADGASVIADAVLLVPRQP